MKEKRYKIGEVAKIVGIPVENIRYFEEKGLISPTKDQFTGYRYYHEEDINRLYDYLKYRNIGFSSADTVSTIHEDGLDTVAERIHQKQMDADRKARYYELKALKLHNFQNVIRNIPLVQESYPLVRRPEIYYVINRRFRDGYYHFEKTKDDKDDLELLIDNYTFVENCFLLRQEWIEEESSQQIFDRGFAIKRKWLDALDLPISEKLTKMESVQSIYTILALSDGIRMDSRVLQPALEHMGNYGYQLNGDVIGNMLLVTHEGDQRVRYVEIWIPVIEK